MPSKPDWNNVLRPGLRGLALEGKDDERIIKAFLNAGKAYWGDWTQKLFIQSGAGFPGVRKQVEQNPGLVWGLVDRDWRSDIQVEELSRATPGLLFLPRIMIDNFLVHPDDLIALLKQAKRRLPDEAAFIAGMDNYFDQALINGALKRTLNDQGAFELSRQEGMLRQVTNTLQVNQNALQAILHDLHIKLNPQVFFSAFQETVERFKVLSRFEQSQKCIDGKLFVDEVVIPKFLRPTFGLAQRDLWIDLLFDQLTSVPADLLPILQALFV